MIIDNHTITQVDDEVPEHVNNIVNPGMYFRAINDLHMSVHKGGSVQGQLNIVSGTVLMVADVRLVDDKPHTIVLRIHPGASRRFSSTCELRVKIEDFTKQFVFAEDGELTRKGELEAAQLRIGEIQKEMQLLMEDPVEMKSRYLLSLQEAGKTMPMVINHSLSPSSSEDILAGDIQEYQAKVSAGMEMVKFASNTMQSVAAKLSEAVADVAPYYQETAAVSVAKVAEALKRAEKINDGVQSMTLWLGTDVYVDKVKIGRSAPAAEKLTIYQKVLFIAPEMSVHFDVNREFSVEQIHEFKSALEKSPELVNQMIPAERGICAVAVRKDVIDKQKTYYQYEIDQANKETFLMIRDGENISFVYSPLWEHSKLSRLFPSPSELAEIYTSRNGSEIDFKDLSYTYALDSHEKLSTLYKRLLVLIGGLQFRERILGPMCTEREAVGFVTKAFSDRFIRYVEDDEGHQLIADKNSLVKNTGLHQFLRFINKGTHSGSEILMDVYTHENEYTVPSNYGGYGDKKYSYHSPEKRLLHAKVAQEKNVFKVMAPFTNGKNKTTYLDGRLEGGNMNTGEISWVNVNAIFADEVRMYLNDRNTRNVSWSYFTELFKKLYAITSDRDSKDSKALVDWDLPKRGISDEQSREIVRAWRIMHPGQLIPSAADKGNSFKQAVTTYVSSRDSLKDLIPQLSSRGETLIRAGLNEKLEFIYWTTKSAQQQDNRYFQDVEVWKTNGVTGAREPALMELATVIDLDFYVNHDLLSEMMSLGKESVVPVNGRKMIDKAFSLDWSKALNTDTDGLFGKIKAVVGKIEYKVGIPCALISHSKYQSMGEKPKALLGVAFLSFGKYGDISLDIFPVDNLESIYCDAENSPLCTKIRNYHPYSFLPSERFGDHKQGDLNSINKYLDKVRKCGFAIERDLTVINEIELENKASNSLQ